MRLKGVSQIQVIKKFHKLIGRVMLTCEDGKGAFKQLQFKER